MVVVTVFFNESDNGHTKVLLVTLHSCMTMLTMLQKDHIDDDCIIEMAVYHGKAKEEMRQLVSEVKSMHG